MRAFCLFSLLLLIAFSLSWAQEIPTGLLTGKVVSRADRQGIASASLSVEGTTLGAATDTAGAFTLKLPEGAYTLRVSCMGYEETRVEGIRVIGGRTAHVTVALAETAIPLNEVQVTADRARRLEDVRTSVLAVAPVQARTLAGVGEDVLRTLQAMPGVVAPNDFSSQLIIRGSGPDQNLIIMDDIEVFNPYRLYGVISMFNPETVSDINLITGGFPAKYGDRLSAVLDVTNREGDKSRDLGGSVNASVTNVNAVLNGRMPFGVAGSYMFSARRTYYDLILGPIAKKTGLVSGDVAFPNFFDVQTKLVIEPTPSHKLIFNGLFSKDGVDLITGPDRKTNDSVSVLDKTRNDVAGVAWQYTPSPSFFSKFGVSWYRNRGDTDFGGDFVDPALDRARYENRSDTVGLRLFNVEFNSRYVFQKYSLKENVGWTMKGHVVEAGIGLDMLTTDIIWHFRPDPTLRALIQSMNFASVEDYVQTRHTDRVNLFVQDKIRLTDQLFVQPGLRFDYYGILKTPYLQPRITASYMVDPLTTVRAAWGIYRQSPGYEKLLDQNAFYDLNNSNLAGITAEKATHYIVGLDRWISNEWQLRVEGYYKRFDDIIVQKYLPGTTTTVYPVPGEDPHKLTGWSAPVTVPEDSLTTIPINAAWGRSYGVEILIEKRNATPDSRLSGWISYALAKAERIRDGLRSPFRFDQRHTVNVVIDYRLNSWLEIGIRWKYGSNFPYTKPIGLKPRVIAITWMGVERKFIQTDAAGNVIFDIDRGGENNRYTAQLPPYHRLDVRFTARADYWGWDWSFYLDVINVYNRKNIMTYRFYPQDDLTIGSAPVGMLPIIPTLGVSVRF